MQVDAYDSTPRGASKPLVTLKDLCDAVDMPLPAGTESSDVDSLGLQVISASNYNDYLAFRGMETLDMPADGYTLLSDMGETVNRVYDAVLKQGVELDLGGFKLHPVQDHVNADASVFVNSMMGMNSGTLVVPDAVLAALNLPPYTSYLLVNYAAGANDPESDAYIAASPPLQRRGRCRRQHRGRLGCRGHAQHNLRERQLHERSHQLPCYLHRLCACGGVRGDPYIQQLSGVSDAGKNYRILSELGTSTRQISHSVLSQQTDLLHLSRGGGHSPLGGGAFGYRRPHRAVRWAHDRRHGELHRAHLLIAYGGYFCVTYLMSKGIVRDAIRAAPRSLRRLARQAADHLPAGPNQAFVFGNSATLQMHRSGVGSACRDPPKGGRMILDFAVWDAIVHSVTDTWLPLVGWLAAIATLWLIARLWRRP